MKTHAQAHVAFLAHFAQLQELEQSDSATLALRSAKEGEIGHLCYEVEEELPLAELFLLKNLLDIPRDTWDTYKRSYCTSVQKWLESHYHRD